MTTPKKGSMSKSLTRQMVFTCVVKHLLTQGKKAIDRDVCQYKASDGKKCAVGCLIKPQCYKSSIEGRPVNTEQVEAALSCSGIEARTMAELLFELQRIHDQSEPYSWREQLKTLAEDQDLKFPPQFA